MPSPAGWAVRFALSPSGRKVIKNVVRTARSEEGRRLIEQAKRVGKSAGHAATSSESRTRLDTVRERLRLRKT